MPAQKMSDGERKVLKWTQLENSSAQFMSVAVSTRIPNENDTACGREACSSPYSITMSYNSFSRPEGI